ncbi:hypothetical protein C5F49_05125 [Nitrosopumilus oxyclinae]|uniref:Uncharacterized protein n=1 Tax=Nitrosopumilus oxyclinae TaxID=1959104 RepID=A0A7D5RBC4_9ARCH|nr:hypothetical protein [Nitrosopumilus oxyclinae]QLH04763.1 hypothetical protein C5F49_05125 [Nitrosopumilus oxyclinae]
MTDKIWLGGIYLKDEGGYEIILKSLNHYKNRLKTLNESPELKESGATFGSILNQQARKTVPKINEVVVKIHASLSDLQILKELEDEKQFLEKALSCYQSDIHKAEDTGNEYFVKLIGDMIQGRKDLKTIKTALDKINNYS